MGKRSITFGLSDGDARFLSDIGKGKADGSVLKNLVHQAKLRNDAGKSTPALQRVMDTLTSEANENVSGDGQDNVSAIAEWFPETLKHILAELRVTAAAADASPESLAALESYLVDRVFELMNDVMSLDDVQRDRVFRRMFSNKL